MEDAENSTYVTELFTRSYTKRVKSSGYSRPHGQALWVIYLMTREEVVAVPVPRTDDFRCDYAVAGDCVGLEDYRGTGYDKGHLAFAADMAFSRWTLSESFYLALQ